MEVVKRHPRLIITAIVSLVVLILAYSSLNSLYNTGVQHEQRLNKQYLDNQNHLSAYISGFYEQVGVAQGATNALDTVLLDAIKGRYEDGQGGGGYTVNSPFFAAIVEAYPEASTAELMRIYGKIADYVQAGRESYRNIQSKLLDMLRVYDTWRYSGLTQSFVVDTILGFPSHRLEARFGNNVARGQDAIDKMLELVLDSKTKEAYESGTLDPLTIPNE